jgi:ATP-dependent helicase/nuclease subunit A
MSIHKSKGLEFPVVFVAELNTRFNMRDSVGECLIDEGLTGLQIVDRNPAAKFPSMAHQIIAERKTCANLAEEMRILYVALTRAREKLILTGSKKQKACRHLLTQCAAMAGPVPDWKLTDIRCHLDWILAGFANESSLHSLFETGLRGDLPDNDLFIPHRVQRDHLDDITRNILNAKRSLTSVTEASKPASVSDRTTQQAFEIIQQNLSWQYPSTDVTQMQAKLSVSELTHRDDEFAAARIERGFTQRPAVVTDTEKQGARPDALSLGTAYHLIIEHLDLSEPVDAKAVQSTILKLVQNGQLSETLASIVDITGVVSFFESPLGKMAQRAGRRVLREWPFTYGLDASAISADASGETVILQGIVDMVIPTDEGLVVVDFKTDRVDGAALEDRAEKYADQLRYYARATADILNQPISSAWLYFLCAQKAVKIKV